MGYKVKTQRWKKGNRRQGTIYGFLFTVNILNKFQHLRWIFSIIKQHQKSRFRLLFPFILFGRKNYEITIHKNQCFLFPSLHLIVKQNYRSKWITEDFGYVKVHEIALLLVPDMLCYNCFLGFVLISLH